MADPAGVSGVNSACSPRQSKRSRQRDAQRLGRWFFPSESETAQRDTCEHMDHIPTLHHPSQNINVMT